MVPIKQQLADILGLLQKAPVMTKPCKDLSLSPVSSVEENLVEELAPSAYASLLRYFLVTFSSCFELASPSLSCPDFPDEELTLCQDLAS